MTAARKAMRRRLDEAAHREWLSWPQWRRDGFLLAHEIAAERAGEVSR